MYDKGEEREDKKTEKKGIQIGSIAVTLLAERVGILLFLQCLG